MNKKGQIYPQDLIENYLRYLSANNIKDDGKHLDEDILTAFVEGNLNEREAAPTVKHLVNCGFCRHVTAELVRLDAVFAEQEIEIPASGRQTEPTSVSDVLSNLLSRIFGTSDSAVLAHQEPEKEEKNPQENKENKENQ